MKIGIMTFWESKNNYGQILQLFALQQHLLRTGHEPFLIKFHRVMPSPEPKQTRNPVINLLRSIKRRIVDEPKLRRIESNDSKREFLSFKAANIKFGDKSYYSLQELIKDPPQADAYICGSDQVWNYNFKVPVNPFLLGFGNKETKRISYAASVGHKQLTEAAKILFSKYIPQFNGISVREKSSIEICNSLNFSNAKWVPDPTLLFNAKEWEQMLKLPEQHSNSGNHIFIYTLGNSPIKDKDRFIAFSKQLTGKKVIHATANSDFSGNVYPTINQWVDAIRNASLIITSSYHGMVFCLIFNRRFIVLPNTGSATGMNDRVESLLGRLGLEEFVMDSYEESRIRDLMERKIDWEKINKNLAEWGVEGREFLSSSLLG